MRITEKAEQAVKEIFKLHNNDELRYHNLLHTLNVVKAARLIAGHCQVKPEDLEKLIVAAWFHDTGYLISRHNHEDASKRLAIEFLHRQHASPEYIETVTSCIEATRIPQRTHNLLQEILCDADMYHVSLESFCEETRWFWDELSAINNDTFEENKYMLHTLSFFEQHHFKTDYGKRELEPGKQKNMQIIRKRLEDNGKR
jgi:HD superfamily phosphodiesterase